MNLFRSFVSVSTFALVVASISVNHSWSAEPPASGTDVVWVTAIAPIGDSSQFVAATANSLLLRESTVSTFDSSDPTTLSPLYTHPAAAWCVDSTSNAKTVASVDYRGNLVVYDVASKKPTTHEKVFERWCQAMVITPDDQFVVAGNEAGKLMVWDLAASKVTKSVEVDAHAITGIAISPDSQLLAASDGAGHVHLLKWPSLDEVGKIEASKETVWCVAFTTDGKQLLCGSSDRNLYRFDAKPDAEVTSIAEGKDWITRIAISEGGQVAASEVSGRLHFPSTGGSDSMKAKSGVWALCWNGDSQLIAGTRKNGLVTAGQSWKWTEAKKPEAKKPDAKKPEAKKPEAKKPEAKKPDAKEADAKEADAKEADAKNTEAKEDKPVSGEANKDSAK